MHKLKLHSIADLVLYAVRNEIVHVQLAAVLPFPERKTGERTIFPQEHQLIFRFRAPKLARIRVYNGPLVDPTIPVRAQYSNSSDSPAIAED